MLRGQAHSKRISRHHAHLKQKVMRIALTRITLGFSSPHQTTSESADGNADAREHANDEKHVLHEQPKFERHSESQVHAHSLPT